MATKQSKLNEAYERGRAVEERRARDTCATLKLPVRHDETPLNALVRRIKNLERGSLDVITANASAALMAHERWVGLPKYFLSALEDLRVIFNNHG